MISRRPRLVSRFGPSRRDGGRDDVKRLNPVSNGARLSNAAFLREINRLADAAQHGKRRKVVSK